MARAAKIVLVLAAVLLLVANGACATAGIVSIGDQGGYAGLAPALIGLYAFFGGVPLGVAAVLVVASRAGGAFPRRGLMLGLLAGAMASALLFFTIANAVRVPLEMGDALYILIFGAGALCAAGVLVALRR